MKLYTLQKIASGVLLGPGGDRAPQHGTSNDHVARTTLTSTVKPTKPKSQVGPVSINLKMEVVPPRKSTSRTSRGNAGL